MFQGVDITFRAFSAELLRSMDLVGYLSIPGGDGRPKEIFSGFAPSFL